MLKPVLAPLIVAALLAWSPARAAAAAPDQADIAEAGRLNQEAIALYRDQRFLEAASKFQAAYELAGAPNVLYNLARSYHQGGKLSEAKRFYEELVLKFPTFDGAKREQAYGYARELDKALAAEQARRDAAAAAAKDAAAKAKAAAEAKAQADAWRERGEELSAAGAHGEAAALYLKAYDAQPAAQWLWLAGGAYEAARDGAAARRQYAALTVLPDAPEPLRARAKARLAALEQPPGGEGTPPLGPDAGPTAPPSGLKIAGWVSFTVGLVAGGIGAWQVIDAEITRAGVRDSVEAAADGGRSVPMSELTLAEARQSQADADDAATLGTILVSVGGAALVGGLVMLLLDDGDDAPAAGTVEVGAAPTRSGLAVTLSGSF